MDMFAALAEPHRRSILEMLASEGQLSASAIAREFRVSPPAISQHLKVLREAGLLRMERRAQQRLYQVNPEAMHDLERWARRMAEQYEQRYQRLERLAKEYGNESVGFKTKQHSNTKDTKGTKVRNRKP